MAPISAAQLKSLTFQSLTEQRNLVAKRHCGCDAPSHNRRTSKGMQLRPKGVLGLRGQRGLTLYPRFLSGELVEPGWKAGAFADSCHMGASARNFTSGADAGALEASGVSLNSGTFGFSFDTFDTVFAVPLLFNGVASPFLFCTFLTSGGVVLSDGRS